MQMIFKLKYQASRDINFAMVSFTYFDTILHKDFHFYEVIIHYIINFFKYFIWDFIKICIFIK